MKLAIVIAALALLLVACGSSSSKATNTVGAATSNSSPSAAATKAPAAAATTTPAATKASPTAAAAATATSVPGTAVPATATHVPATATHVPATATPAPPPATATSQPASQPITLTGTGASVSDPVTLGKGLIVVHMTHNGSSNFIVQLIDSVSATTTEYLSNEVGVADFTTAAQLQDGGTFILQVTADGSWTIDIQPVTPATGEHLSVPLDKSGTGSQVIYWVDLPKGVHKVTGTHNGSSNFIVEAFPTVGTFLFPDSVFNEVGVFSGAATIQTTDAGPYLISVQADGNWTLKIE